MLAANKNCEDLRQNCLSMSKNNFRLEGETIE